jgi:hypothetical protein
MVTSVDNVVMCEACKERVAEIISEDGHKLCSACHLQGVGAKTPRDRKADPDK